MFFLDIIYFDFIIKKIQECMYLKKNSMMNLHIRFKWIYYNDKISFSFYKVFQGVENNN